MKKLFLILIGVIFLTGCAKLPNPPFGGGTIASSLLLKVSKDKILSSETITVPEQIILVASSTGETIIIPAETFVRYEYISAIEIPTASITVNKKVIQEDLSKRTENSQHFKIKETEYQGNFFGGKPFYKDADKWFQTETATTTLEAWNAQITLSDRIKDFFGRKALAVDYYAHDGGSGTVYTASTADWATRRAATGNTAEPAAETSGIGTYSTYLYRYFFTALTDIGADKTITAAVLNVYRQAQYGGTYAIGVSASTQTDPTALAIGDFDNLTLDSPTEFASRVSINDAGYNAFTFTDFSGISKTSYTKLVLRDGTFDIDNTDPSGVQYETIIYNAAYAGTDHDPYLSITYTTSVPSLPKANSYWE